MEITLVSLSVLCFFLVWALVQEKKKSAQKKVKAAYKKVYLEKHHHNLSSGAYALFVHMNKIISAKNGRNPNRKIGTRILKNESVYGNFYNFTIFALENNFPIESSWYDIEADLSEALVNYLSCLINHVNKGYNIVLVNNENERRAFLVDYFGVAVGEIVITSDDFNHIEYEKEKNYVA